MKYRSKPLLPAFKRPFWGKFLEQACAMSYFRRDPSPTSSSSLFISYTSQVPFWIIILP